MKLLIYAALTVLMVVIFKYIHIISMDLSIVVLLIGIYFAIMSVVTLLEYVFKLIK